MNTLGKIGCTFQIWHANRIVSACMLAIAATSCTNVERSRDVGNPNVSAAVTAQQVCSTCHGMTGNSPSPNFPRLAGQPAAYLEAQLKNFRDKQRSDKEGTQYMWGLSRKMSDAQIQGLADYFSKQTPEPNAAADSELMAAGKTIVEHGIPEKGVPACLSCHGPQAEGQAIFPRLAGQHQNYIVKQLKVFKYTDGRPGTPMTQVAGNLDAKDLNAVAAYLQAISRENISLSKTGISLQ